MSKEKLEKLEREKYVVERKLTAAMHKEKRLQSELKRLTRSERTHRLCTRAGMLETFLKEPTTLTDDDVMELFLLRDPLTASYFVAVWKMLRKKGCVPSALTQNVKDLLASREIENILDNTDFMILLSQAQSDRAILAKQIGISEHQLSYITQSNSGEGLLFYGSVTIPFVDRFPRGEIYDLLTTKPEDAANGKQAE